MKIIIKLLRVKHWVKNLFIFIPLFFSGDFFSSEKFIPTTIVFIGFSFIASFIYIINDVFDKEFDKIHPEKKHRPIASGKISIRQSLIIGVFVLVAGLIIVWNISINGLLLSIFYVVLNFLYTTKLKQIPIVDFIIIAVGFIIRILIGGEIGSIELTQWVIVMVFLLSLFIAVTKRRDDVYQYESFNKLNRKVVSDYTVEYMDNLITIISSVLLVSYLLFITSEDVFSRYSQKYLIVSFLFVLIGIFRYNQITYVKNKSGSPINILFKDLFLQITILFWFLTFFGLIYFI